MEFQKTKVRLTVTLIVSFVLGVGVGALSYFKFSPWNDEHPKPELYIISSGPLLQPDLMDLLERSLGVKLKVVVAATTGEFLAYVQRDLEKVDLLVPKSSEIEPLANQNLLAPIDLNRIPNHKNISPDFRSETLLLLDSSNSSRLIPLQWGFAGILYDRTKISQPIRSWNDLWEQPELLKKIAISTHPEEIFGFLSLPLELGNLKANAKQPKDPHENALDQLLERVLVEPDPLAKLSSGEVYAVQTTNGKAAQLADRFQFAIPEDRVSLWVQSVAMTPKGAMTPAVYDLINMLLDEKNARLLVALNQEATTNELLNDDSISEFQKARYLRKIPLPAMNLVSFRGKVGLAWESLIRARIHQRQASL